MTASAAASLADSTPEPHRRQLQRLATLRWIALAALAGTIGVANLWLEAALPVGPLAAVVAAASALNVWTSWRAGTPKAVPQWEVTAQLLADTLALTAVLYFTGGWSNPFVSLFLLPVVIAATLLSPRHAWLMAAAALVCYSLLGVFHVPLAHDHTGASGSFSLHVLGMWVSFVLSAGVVAHFVVRMAASLRARDRELALARERFLRDQHVLALGTLAAGAAHQLGTPLSTMAVVVGELAHEQADRPDVVAALAQVRRQVDVCKSILSELVTAAGQARGESAAAEPLDAFVHRTVETWQTLRPGSEVAVRFSGQAPPPRIVTEQSLGHTLIALLDNAADASKDGIELEAGWTPAALFVEIRDRGHGVPARVLASAGQARTTTKPDGHGVGLLIANAALERLGGRVTLANLAGGGACTRVELPLAVLAAG